MARIDASFNFGANAKPKKPKAKKGKGGKSDSWRAYVSGKRKR